MKKNLKRLFIGILGIASISFLFNSCVTEDNPARVSARSTSILVATDRHESGSGNNLAAAVQSVVGASGVVVPSVVLLGGDYVGSGPDEGETGQPVFSIDDMKSELFMTLDPARTQTFFTYGSHDRNCIEGYNAFFSGPKLCDGYYIYGISYAQMAFPTDSVSRALVALYEQQEPKTDTNTGELPNKLPTSDDNRPYNGIDVVDPLGISAESAAASFTSWVESLNNSLPIVVMSHMPIHANRHDNPGGERWYKALSKAAQKHDIILFFGHNHTPEERGDLTDQNSYLLVSGDSISVQGDSNEGVTSHKLNFTYTNAGYIKLGWCTLITFTDNDGDGRHDNLQLRRFHARGDKALLFGTTDKNNPWNLPLCTIKQ